MIALSPRDSSLETMSLFFVLGDTKPLSCLDRGFVNHVCPCLCLSTAAIRFFTPSPSVEAGCAVTLASAKSVEAVCGGNSEHRWWHWGWGTVILVTGLIITNPCRPQDDFKRCILQPTILWWKLAQRQHRCPNKDEKDQGHSWREISSLSLS